VANGQIEGLDDIIRKLKLLPEKIGNNAVRRSLRKGANVIAAKARVNAKRIDDPESRERIHANIGVASGGRKRERAAGGVMMRVGVRGGARLSRTAHIGTNKKGETTFLEGGNTTHWRMVELGTSTMAAQPFLVPAAAEGAGRAVAVVVADLNKQIDIEIAKL